MTSVLVCIKSPQWTFYCYLHCTKGILSALLLLNHPSWELGLQSNSQIPLVLFWLVTKMHNNLRYYLLVTFLCFSVAIHGVQGGAMVTGSVFCDQCKDGQVSLFDYPLSGILLLILLWLSLELSCFCVCVCVCALLCVCCGDSLYIYIWMECRDEGDTGLPGEWRASDDGGREDHRLARELRDDIWWDPWFKQLLHTNRTHRQWGGLKWVQGSHRATQVSEAHV